VEKLFGTIDAKADAKGRVPIPALFRRVLLAEGETSLVVRKHIYKDCLVLYTQAGWDAETALLQQALNLRDEYEDDLDRTISAYANHVEVDTSGRILIPRTLAALSGIKTEMTFLGRGDNLEIWDREKLKTTLLSHSDLKEAYRKLFSRKRDEH